MLSRYSIPFILHRKSAVMDPYGPLRKFEKSLLFKIRLSFNELENNIDYLDLLPCCSEITVLIDVA